MGCAGLRRRRELWRNQGLRVGRVATQSWSPNSSTFQYIFKYIFVIFKYRSDEFQYIFRISSTRWNTEFKYIQVHFKDKLYSWSYNFFGRNNHCKSVKPRHLSLRFCNRGLALSRPGILVVRAHKHPVR